jgi:hypothetical protein
MPRASWRGFLRLSLVSCPIYLSPATTRAKSIRLHQVYVAEDAWSDQGEGQQGSAPSAPRLLVDDASLDGDQSPAATRVTLESGVSRHARAGPLARRAGTLARGGCPDRHPLPLIHSPPPPKTHRPRRAEIPRERVRSLALLRHDKGRDRSPPKHRKRTSLLRPG